MQRCDRVLGAWRNADPLDGLEANDDTDSGDTDDDAPVDVSADPSGNSNSSE